MILIPSYWHVFQLQQVLPLKKFSTSSQKNGFPKTGPAGKPPQSTSNVPKVLVGGAVAAGAAMLAYRSGYLDQFIFKDPESSANSTRIGIGYKDEQQNLHFSEQKMATMTEEPGKVMDGKEQTVQRAETLAEVPSIEVQPVVETPADLPRVEIEQKDEPHGDLPHVQGEDRVQSKTDVHDHQSLSGTQQSYTQEKIDGDNEDGSIDVQGKKEPGFSQSTNAEHSPSVIDLESQAPIETTKGVQVAAVQTKVNLDTEKDETQTMPQQHLATKEESKVF